MNILNEVRVFAPATVANVAVGFDILGFAIHGPGDEVVLRRVQTPGLRISTITGTGEKQLPLAAERNTAGFAALSLLEHLGKSDLGGTWAPAAPLKTRNHSSGPGTIHWITPP